MTNRTQTADRDTLHQRLLKHEHERHANRLKSIKAMEIRLRALEPIINALEADGLRLCPDNIEFDYDGNINLGYGYGFRSGHLACAALQQHGFLEIARSNYTDFAAVVLKKGQLRVSLYISTTITQPLPCTTEGA